MKERLGLELFVLFWNYPLESYLTAFCLLRKSYEKIDVTRRIFFNSAIMDKEKSLILKYLMLVIFNISFGVTSSEQRRPGGRSPQPPAAFWGQSLCLHLAHHQPFLKANFFTMLSPITLSHDLSFGLYSSALIFLPWIFFCFFGSLWNVSPLRVLSNFILNVSYVVNGYWYFKFCILIVSY